MSAGVPFPSLRTTSVTDIVLKYLEDQAHAGEAAVRVQARAQGDGESFEVTPVKCPNTTAGYRLFKQRKSPPTSRSGVQALRPHVRRGGEPQHPRGGVRTPGRERHRRGLGAVQDPRASLPARARLRLGPGRGGAGFVGTGGARPKGLPQLILENINKCDVDVRKDLFGSILLAGGGSLFGSLRERLEVELHDAAPTNVRVKVTASANAVERKFATWIGGSILASLGSFQQMWMSKQEYEEHGAQLVHKKCP